MRKMMGLLICVLQCIFLIGCASEEVKEEPKLVEKEVSCTINQLDGECRVFKSFIGDRENGDSYFICSIGTCSEGDCENGKGTLSFPAGSKLEGTFKKGKLNGKGSYEGCGGSYSGTFKDNLKEKGVEITREKLKSGGEYVTYYDGSYQNEMRNGKGIYYYSSSNDSNIYEGNWKDGNQNGPFVVYSNFKGVFPISENGIVLKSSYEGFNKITYVNGYTKEEWDQEERERKEERRRIAQEEAEEKRRIAQEEADRRRAENSRKSYKKKECEEGIELCMMVSGASYSTCKYQMKKESIYCD